MTLAYCPSFPGKDRPKNKGNEVLGVSELTVYLLYVTYVYTYTYIYIYYTIVNDVTSRRPTSDTPICMKSKN